MFVPQCLARVEGFPENVQMFWKFYVFRSVSLKLLDFLKNSKIFMIFVVPQCLARVLGFPQKLTDFKKKYMFFLQCLARVEIS